MAEKQKKKSVLIVSADSPFIKLIDNNLCLQGFETKIARTYAEAFTIIDKSPPDIVFCDIQELPAHEMDLVSFAKSHSPSTEIVILTGMQELEDATQAVR